LRVLIGVVTVPCSPVPPLEAPSPVEDQYDPDLDLVNDDQLITVL